MKLYKLKDGYLLVEDDTVIAVFSTPEAVEKFAPQFTKRIVVFDEDRDFTPHKIVEDSPFKEFNPPEVIEKNGEKWYRYKIYFDARKHKHVALYGPGYERIKVRTNDDELQSILRNFYFTKDDFKAGETFTIEIRRSTLDNPLSRDVAVKFGEINVIRTDNPHDPAVRFTNIGEFTVEALGYGLTVIVDATTHEILVEETHAVGSHNLDTEKLEKLAVAFKAAGFKVKLDYEFGGELEVKDPETNETLVLFDCNNKIFYKPSIRKHLIDTFKNYKGVKI